jgi:hypothetical protein
MLVVTGSLFFIGPLLVPKPAPLLRVPTFLRRQPVGER